MNPRLAASASSTGSAFPAKKLKPSFSASAASAETGLETLIEGGASASGSALGLGSAASPKKLSSRPACFSAAGSATEPASTAGRIISTVLIERPPLTGAWEDFLISLATFCASNNALSATIVGGFAGTGRKEDNFTGTFDKVRPFCAIEGGFPSPFLGGPVLTGAGTGTEADSGKACGPSEAILNIQPILSLGIKQNTNRNQSQPTCFLLSLQLFPTDRRC